MLTKIYMNWIIKIDDKSVSVNDLINKYDDRSEILILLKVITNIENKIKEKLSIEEMSLLTVTLEKKEDTQFSMSLMGNDDIVKKVNINDFVD